MSAPYSYTQSPTALRNPTAPTALRRQHAVQPPSLLTTSLGNARNSGIAAAAGVAQTPVSTNSLSTPFSAYSSQSPGGAMRGTSPMTFRSNVGFSAPYNPQQWGLVNEGSPQSSSSPHGLHRGIALAPRLVGPDEPVSSPPPPYSPRRADERQASPRNATDLASPSDTTSPEDESSQSGTPLSAATTLSPDLYSAQSRSRDAAQAAFATASPTSPPSFPPPPPTSGAKSRARPMPRLHTSGLLSSLRHKASNSTITADSINVLQESTQHALAHAPHASYRDGSAKPPAARRAASTGAIGYGESSSRSNSNSPSPVTWKPTAPLPPPPPGPPPTAARSQSLSRFSESPSSSLAPTLPFRQHRAPPGTGTALETVPPTPAGWRDESSEPSRASRTRSRSNGPSPLHIDTGSILYKRRAEAGDAQTARDTAPSHLRRDSSSSALFRSPAVRNRSAKGIRERRSESRNGKGKAVEDAAADDYHEVSPWDEDDGRVKPTDLVLSAGQLSKLRTSPRSSPRNGQSMQSLDGAMKSPEILLSSGKAVSFQSSNATPQPDSPRSRRHASSSATPVFSPRVDTYGSPAAIHSISSPGLAGLPGGMSLDVLPGRDQRPISHLLHMPNSDDSMQVPLTPASASKVTQRPMSDLIGPESPAAFALRANDRHRDFAAREAAASSNSEKLDLFVQFMITESRVRRDQYASVFEDEEVQVEELMQGFFCPSPVQESSKLPQPESSKEASRRTSIASSTQGDSSSQDESSSVSRMQESPGSITSNSSIAIRPDIGWNKDYKPCLSPIASMSIVTGQDEIDSRGRAPSRWWEGDGFDVLARSKRESKYMGVPKEARDSPGFYDNRMSGSASNSQWQAGEASHQESYGSNEYPPEKGGWDEESTPQQRMPPTPKSAPFTPSSRRLDISRLVTLPPPYPRHHPAVNNSHPDLDSIRSVVRSLHEKSDVDAIRETYRTQMQTKRQRAGSWQQHQRSLHQQEIQFSISRGELSSSQYEAAEADLEEKLLQSQKETTQADFDTFQDTVVSPVHAIYTERIRIATDSLHSLSTSLLSSAQSPSPNFPQEEGDETPELLERLTILKWLFEARESCHRHIYDLLTDRNDLYKAIVLLPYKNNSAKTADAQDFFTKDAQERKKVFDRTVADRYQAFLSVIEGNVSGGVEVQLDAFWQIAPPLKTLLNKIPTDLEGSGFEVLIPADEYAENPSYHEHPLQYLYSLLSHAEKSTYQFIESQVNLLCLLHEIRNAALAARLRAEAGERVTEGGDPEEWINQAAEDEKKLKEARLTEDLKEKVGVVEGQWGEALGEELVSVRERIRGHLLMEGGWEDEDEGVVSPI